MNRLLIVEDEKMIRQGIKAMVMRSGVEIEEIIECKNGLEALEVLKEQIIDVMITDIRMPKMDGITLVKEIQKLSEKPKIVVVSGYDDFSYAVELLRYGAKEYLLKPVEREKIVNILKVLDNEIEQEQQCKKEQLKLVHKELKYFLLEEGHTIYGMDREIVKILQEKDYFVICISSQEHQEFLQPIIDIQEIEGQEVLVVFAEQKEKFITEALGQLLYGESNKHRGIEELKIGYKEATINRKEHFWGIKGEKHKASDCTQKIQGEELIERLTQLIGTEKMDEAIKTILFLQHQIEKSDVSIEEFEGFIQQLFSKIEETYFNIIDHENKTLKALKEIYGFPCETEYFEVLIQWLQDLHQVIEEEFNDYKNKKKIQQAVKYIQENFNKDLNMAVVSNYVSMNYSLFSVVFKQYTGMNFVNYLRNIRFEEAKKLLATTDKKVIEISALVGYENEKHFMKAFKNIVGVSPSEYRKNVQIGNIYL